MEEWKEVKNTNGDYLISNLGNIKSRRYSGKYKLLNPTAGCNGYYSIKIRYENTEKRRTTNIHRLVAEYFIDKPKTDEKLEVNHKDSNRLNNNANNLEWVTSSGNTEHAIKNRRLIPWNNEVKPIKAINIETGEIIIYSSLSKAEIDLGTRHIVDVLKGRRNQTKGYTFEYIKGR